MRIDNVAIVGCGPAGIAAAIQLERSGLEPIVFERQRIGGLLVNAHLVENYPGFPEGIPGPELVRLMEAHLEKLAVKVLQEKVTRVDRSEGHFVVTTSERTIHSKALVIASGTKPRQIPGLNIPEDAGESILYEIYPIRDVRGRRIAVVGAGDAAFDYALSLERNNDVKILNRTEKMKCLELLWRRVRSSERIEYLANTVVETVRWGKGGEVTLGCRTPTGGMEIPVDYVIIAVGREPELGFLAGPLTGFTDEKSEAGFLSLIGDAKGGRIRQASIAVGDGIKAAMNIQRMLAGETAA
jgi:thioredoxin reductase